MEDQSVDNELVGDARLGPVSEPAFLREANNVSLRPPVLSPSVPGGVSLNFTDDQFAKWMACQSRPQPRVALIPESAPNASLFDTPVHALSPSETDEGGVFDDFDSPGPSGVAPRLSGPDGAVIGNNPGEDFMALFKPPNDTSLPNDDDVRLEELGLAWAACYAQEEAAGPNINQGLADIVGKYMRAKPSDENIRVSLAKISVPGNCPRLVVPSLDSDVQLALRKLNSKLTERVLAKVSGIVCKAMVPVLNVLSEVIEKKVDIPHVHTLALSEAMALLSTAVCVASQGRKNNVQNSIDEPLLRQLCGPDTPVGEKELFGFNVNDKVAELKKAQRLGFASGSRGLGPMRGRRRPPSRPYFRGWTRGVARGGGQYYAASGGRGSRPFLSRGQRGRGRGQ